MIQHPYFYNVSKWLKMSTVQSLVAPPIVAKVDGNIPTVTTELVKLVTRTKTKFRDRLIHNKRAPAAISIQQKSEPQPEQVLVPRAIIQLFEQALYTSKLNLRVNRDFASKSKDMTLQAEYQTKLTKLVQWVDDSKIPWPSRTIEFSLVAVTSSKVEEERPWLCVHGLQTKQDITYFHLRLSTKLARATYHPLKLCYDQSLIRRGAAMGNLVLEGSGRTLCGRSILHGSDGQTWYSTLGGVLQANGRFFAITTSHRPEVVSGTLDSLSMNSDSILNDLDVNVQDFQQAIIIDETSWHHVELIPPEGNPNPASLSVRDFGCGHELVLDETIYEGPDGSDWCLHEIEPSVVRPNFIHHTDYRRYITSTQDVPRKSSVAILSARGGIIQGELSTGISYLKPSSGKRSILCWTVHIESDHGKCEFRST